MVCCIFFFFFLDNQALVLWRSQLTGRHNERGALYLHAWKCFGTKDRRSNSTWSFVVPARRCHSPHCSLQNVTIRSLLPQRVISRFAVASWPPCSSDLSPPDFYLWEYLKSKVYNIRLAVFDDLMSGIRQEIENIPEEALQRVMEDLFHIFTTVHPVWRSRFDRRCFRGVKIILIELCNTLCI
jgi:hypothetical protein